MQMLNLNKLSKKKNHYKIIKNKNSIIINLIINNFN